MSTQTDTKVQRDQRTSDEASEKIGQAFAFIRDVSDMPSIVDDMPEKASIAFREINVSGHAYRLVATRAVGSERWMAKPSRYAVQAGSSAFLRPVVDDRGQLHDSVAIIETFRASAKTAEAALDALARKLQFAIGEATRFDVGNGNTRLE